MSKAYKLLVFDWDGTLMDSSAEIVHCFRSAATEVGLPPPSPEAVRDIIGLGMREAVARLFPDLDETTYQDLIQAYRRFYFDPEREPAQLFEGSLDLIEALERRGYLLAVATGKGRRGLDRALARTGLDRLFHFSRCVDEARSKPHPQMLLDIMDRLGAEPRETLMVGDTEYDLLMAANAGVDAVAVCCGAHDRERLLGLAPRACLPHTQHLLDWLEA